MFTFFFRFSLSLNEKIDLQEIEINELNVVLGELRNEIRSLNDKDEHRRSPVVPMKTSSDEQQRLLEEMDKKIYELETERTCLVFEHERLKTNLDLCIDEKQHLVQQRAQTSSELKKLKLRVLALQDQVHKLRRNNLTNNNKKSPTKTKRRINKKNGRKSCLEMLLDQNQSVSIMEDLHDRSSIIYRPKETRRRNFNDFHLHDHHTETSWMKRKTRANVNPRKRCSFHDLFFVFVEQNNFFLSGGPSKKNVTNKTRLFPDPYSNFARKSSNVTKTTSRVKKNEAKNDFLH